MLIQGPLQHIIIAAVFRSDVISLYLDQNGLKDADSEYIADIIEVCALALQLILDSNLLGCLQIPMVYKR